MLTEREAPELAYTIVFVATMVGSTPWGGDLPSAKRHAMVILR
jgi:hypothetical protein